MLTKNSRDKMKQFGIAVPDGNLSLSPAQSYFILNGGTPVVNLDGDIISNYYKNGAYRKSDQRVGTKNN